MSLRPDQLFGAFSLIVEDVCGPYASIRKEDLTAQEWTEIDHRWQTLKLMNRPKEGEHDSH